MEEIQKLVKKFYNEIISSPDFNGNYFEAMINAIALAKAWIFIKNRLKK